MVLGGGQSEAGRLAHELEQWVKKMKCSGTTGLSLGKLTQIIEAASAFSPYSAIANFDLTAVPPLSQLRNFSRPGEFASVTTVKF